MSRSLLEVKGLSKTFTTRKLFRKSEFHAVRDVNFTVRQGEVLAVVGESGSGKSTIARMVANLIPPTDGDIIYDGISLRHNRQLQKELPRHVQMIFQDPFAALNPQHTIGYIIGRPLQLHNKQVNDVRGKVLELLTKVGLTPAEEFIEKHPYQLSGGQKQRVVIAKVLGLNPKIIVADEPTSMLDVSIGVDVMNLMLDLKADSQMAYILITHNLGSARYMADKMIVMFAGQVVESGETEAVIANPKHPYTRLLLHSSPDPWKDPEATIEVIDLKAGVPSDGCSFRHRCPFAAEACKHDIPLVAAGDGQQVRCRLYQ
ncbi:peptide ABC transporter ATPase [Gordoniibacillus kamchatkensis]|uniref:Peptide ABC transporter ATPase n=1 Tax=Gordoniibacillus kamchatkensis TaxID=1590651 RepID=A0ABR5AID8_9BACL|nr:ABC transporter ATP-binding protein [Paenibacillus sp. VKM B-2647]KIL40518.1 peptide ABC transporter ATPase [Paenibacillus sp. VKM B-2647]